MLGFPAPCAVEARSPSRGALTHNSAAEGGRSWMKTVETGTGRRTRRSPASALLDGLTGPIPILEAAPIMRLDRQSRILGRRQGVDRADAGRAGEDRPAPVLGHQGRERRGVEARERVRDRAR